MQIVTNGNSLFLIEQISLYRKILVGTHCIFAVFGLNQKEKDLCGVFVPLVLVALYHRL